MANEEWRINNIRVVTQVFDNTETNIIARLHPFGGGTIHHFFGYEDGVYRMAGLVVGFTDRNALLSMAKDDTAYAVIGWEQNEGTYYVKNVNTKRRLGVWRQTFLVDLSHAETDPIWDVEFELYKVT